MTAVPIAIHPLRSSTSLPQAQSASPYKVKTKEEHLRALAREADNGRSVPTSHLSDDDFLALLSRK